MQVKKQQLELDMEQQTGSKSEKECIKAIYCHPAYLSYAEYIMKNARLDEAQATIFLLAILIVAVITSICDWGFRMTYNIFIAFTLRGTPGHSS